MNAAVPNRERYRSGHNGADSKSDGQGDLARGFESHPLRQLKNAPPRGIFYLWWWVGGRTHWFDQNALHSGTPSGRSLAARGMDGSPPGETATIPPSTKSGAPR